ncbi:MAG TPA: hypothetical protein HPP77_04355 [Candidatus Hydrogenedentes bacterium]|nr:hypothetical protein [Candidatus Hydrogenedentota bacterium]HIJ73279.1 hypothetical protein [Candidatus Hydrogenedentota bacterium]
MEKSLALSLGLLLSIVCCGADVDNVPSPATAELAVETPAITPFASVGRGTSPAETSCPFPDAMDAEPDPRIAELLSIRAADWTSRAASDAHKELVSMGAEPVPSLIILFKRAANKECLVTKDDRPVSDISRGELRAALVVLQESGDRRALPVISRLVEYDSKAGRFGHALREILSRESNEQILGHAQSEDPNVARSAERILKRRQPGQSMAGVGAE